MLGLYFIASCVQSSFERSWWVVWFLREAIRRWHKTPKHLLEELSPCNWASNSTFGNKSSHVGNKSSHVGNKSKFMLLLPKKSILFRYWIFGSSGWVHPDRRMMGHLMFTSVQPTSYQAYWTMGTTAGFRSGWRMSIYSRRNWWCFPFISAIIGVS